MQVLLVDKIKSYIPSLQDYLNGIDMPVSFMAKEISGKKY